MIYNLELILYPCMSLPIAMLVYSGPTPSTYMRTEQCKRMHVRSLYIIESVDSINRDNNYIYIYI